MIFPIQGICSRMKYPRKQHACLKLAHQQYSVLTDDGEIPVTDLETAWNMIEQIKNGRLYDEKH